MKKFDRDLQNNTRNDAPIDALLRPVGVAELFHTPADETFATVAVGDHHEHLPLMGEAFKSRLVKALFETEGRPPSAAAISKTVRLFDAIAKFGGKQRDVFTRVGCADGAVYLDLCNAQWEVVEITGDGWRVIKESPVRFRRAKGMLPLPAPLPGGSLDELRRLINVAEDGAWMVIVGWLVGALHPRGPYPILTIHGPQGTAKSTLTWMLRSLVDPSVSPARTAPRNERDLLISASNSWIMAFDNLSAISDAMADAYCRLSTGGGLATRRLYTNADETIFQARRPMIFNGIEELGLGRQDLLDRCMAVALAAIDQGRRRPEEDIRQSFEQARPRILGAVLDAVSAALANSASTQLRTTPRMADFAKWVDAAETALPWEAGEFLHAYTENRHDVVVASLENDPVASGLRLLLEDSARWEGTGTGLVRALLSIADGQVPGLREHLRAANRLTGRLRRLQASLRADGIEVKFERKPGGVRQRTISISRSDDVDRPHRPAAVDGVTPVSERRDDTRLEVGDADNVSSAA